MPWKHGCVGSNPTSSTWKSMGYKDKEKRRKYQREWAREYLHTCRIRILMLLGGQCNSCCNNDMRVLHVDHIDGGGNVERKMRGGGDSRSLWRLVKKNPYKYQILCANCNFIKMWEHKETPLRIPST